jgi:hypothetical protein
MEKSPSRKPSEDFRTDLATKGESDTETLDLGVIETLDGVQVNPEAVDDVVGSGGLFDFLTGVAKHVLKRIINS